MNVMFPSPYGVSFILTVLGQALKDTLPSGFRLLTEYHSFLLANTDRAKEFRKFIKFPSPYGVSFILTRRSILL